MPPALIRRILLCLLIAAPAVVLRVTGIRLFPVLDLLAFGASVVAAAFLLAWAAEAAHKDISGTLAIALLAVSRCCRSTPSTCTTRTRPAPTRPTRTLRRRT